MIKNWNEFWFSPTNLWRVSLFRLLFGATAFLFYLIRHFDLSLFFFQDGMMSLEASKSIYEGVMHSPFFWFPEQSSSIVLLHAVLLFCLVCISLGFFSRYFAALGLYVHVLFEQRNLAIMYGADKVVACWLLYLILMNSDEHFSIKKHIFKNKKAREMSEDLLTPVGVRLIQIQLCVIYAYSGLEKLKGPSWWRGDALWNIISNGAVIPFDTNFIARFPLFIAAGVFTTLFWEIYFCFAIWNKKLRPYWLLAGVGFHFTIAVMMNLVFFGLLMIVAYLFFVEWSQLKKMTPIRAISK